jgi:hypothetical protein
MRDRIVCNIRCQLFENEKKKSIKGLGVLVPRREDAGGCGGLRLFQNDILFYPTLLKYNRIKK